MKTYVINHQIKCSAINSCRTCNTNLDYYSEIVDCDDSLEVNWQVVKCFRCGCITIIHFK